MGLKVNFYFDVMSPYTYFAFQILKRYRTLWDLEVTFLPFNLRAIMAGSNNTPPAMVPNRALFLSNDLKRNADWFKLETTFKGMPDNFFSEVGKPSILLNRLLCVVCSSPVISETNKWKAVDAAFRIIWEDPRYRNKSLFYLPSGLDGLQSDFLSQASLGDQRLTESQGRYLLKEHTERALGLHAFGSPILHFENHEIFFGSDRFEQIAFIFNLPWYGPTPDSGSRM
jgi:glutathione S-transferase kappa 1